MNRAISSKWKERSKGNFFASSHSMGQIGSRVEGHRESLSHSSAEGFPRNAIKWRNEIPMTPMAAAFQRAHENGAEHRLRRFHVKFGNGSS